MLRACSHALQHKRIYLLPYTYRIISTPSSPPPLSPCCSTIPRHRSQLAPGFSVRHDCDLCSAKIFFSEEYAEKEGGQCENDGKEAHDLRYTSRSLPSSLKLSPSSSSSGDMSSALSLMFPPELGASEQSKSSVEEAPKTTEYPPSESQVVNTHTPASLVSRDNAAKSPSQIQAMDLAVVFQVPGAVHTPCSQHAETLRLQAALSTIATTADVEEAWEAFESVASNLFTHGITKSESHLQRKRLHRLVHLIASARPHTRTTFLRLTTVLKMIRDAGHRTSTWQWNTLMNSAGKGSRTASAEDYRLCLEMLREMKRGKHPAEPDITTYNILLSVASRTKSSNLVRHAMGLLSEATASIKADRITYLTLLSYFIRTSQLHEIQAVIERMERQGLSLGSDGVNACTWTLAKHGYLNLALDIYEQLRSNCGAKPDWSRSSSPSTSLDLVTIRVPRDVLPNHRTYTSLVQALAYHGDLFTALTVFTHFLETIEESTISSGDFSPTLPIYRALFLGYSIHARSPSSHWASLLTHVPPPSLTSHSDASDSLESFPPRAIDPESSPWTLENLWTLFESFLRHEGPPARSIRGHDTKKGQPSERLVFWIATSFYKLSDGNAEVMDTFWRSFEKVFGPRPREKLRFENTKERKKVLKKYRREEVRSCV